MTGERGLRSRRGRRLPRPMFRRARRFAGFVRFFGMRLVRAICGRWRSRGGMWRTNRTGVKGQRQPEGEQSPKESSSFHRDQKYLLPKDNKLSARLGKNDGGFYLPGKRIPRFGLPKGEKCPFILPGERLPHPQRCKTGSSGGSLPGRGNGRSRPRRWPPAG